MKTVFLIVNYNDVNTTIRLLESIQSYACIDAIVIVDNCSTDDSFSILQKYTNAKIHVIQNDANKGYGSAINFGSKYIETLYKVCRICVSNSDIEIAKEEDLKLLLQDFPDDAGIVAPIVKEHSGENRGWKIPSPWQDGLLNLLGIHRFLKRIILYPNSHYKNQLAQVDAVSGSFFVIDSLALKQCSYFDEKLFLYYEENVIGRKMQSIGYKTYVNTTLQVFHNHSVTIDKNISRDRKYRVLKKSQLYFHQTYNDAGLIAQLFLRGTEQFSFFFLKFWYLVK